MPLGTGPIRCLSASPLTMMTILAPGGVTAIGILLFIDTDLTPAQVPNVGELLEADIFTSLTVPGLACGPLGVILAALLVADPVLGVVPTLGTDHPFDIDLHLPTDQAPDMVCCLSVGIAPGTDRLPQGAGHLRTATLAPFGIPQLTLLILNND